MYLLSSNVRTDFFLLLIPQPGVVFAATWILYFVYGLRFDMVVFSLLTFVSITSMSSRYTQ